MPNLNLTLKNLHVEETAFAFYLESSITEDDIGKAVTIDTSAEMTMKLAGNDEVVLGFLDTFEDRGDFKIGAVQQKGGFALPYTGTAPSLGHGIVGSATAGVVKTTGAAATAGQPRVFKVNTAKSEVEVTLL